MDSVWAELGLACLYRSRRKIRQPFFPFSPRIRPAGSMSRAEIRAGI